MAGGRSRSGQPHAGLRVRAEDLGPARSRRARRRRRRLAQPTGYGRQSMTTLHDVVFLRDVDDTLLDNDQVERDVRRHLEQSLRVTRPARYWEIFEELRTKLGYADYVGALQQFRFEHLRDPHVLEISLFLIDYPFANRLYPGALDVIARLRGRGLSVILSDGDVVFQPRKIERSGLLEATEGRVLVYIHKEQVRDDVEQRFPARHYVMVDDKLRVLGAMKKIWDDCLTSVFLRQGHLALNPTN